MGEKEKTIEMKHAGSIRGLKPYKKIEKTWFFKVPLPDGNFMEVEAIEEDDEKTQED